MTEQAGPRTRARRAATAEESGGNGDAGARTGQGASKTAPREEPAAPSQACVEQEGWDGDFGVTPYDVIQGLLTEARGEGKDSTASTRVSAWEKLGKLLGMFDEKPDDISPRVLLG